MLEIDLTAHRMITGDSSLSPSTHAESSDEASARIWASVTVTETEGPDMLSTTAVRMS